MLIDLKLAILGLQISVIELINFMQLFKKTQTMSVQYLSSNKLHNYPKRPKLRVYNIHLLINPTTIQEDQNQEYAIPRNSFSKISQLFKKTRVCNTNNSNVFLLTQRCNSKLNKNASRLVLVRLRLPPSCLQYRISLQLETS